jgi:enoyl-CoA hydratase
MSTNDRSDLVIKRQGDTTRITLNRPGKGNSLSSALVGALSAAVENCYHDGTRMLVIEANGANFCTGFDLSNLESETDDSLLARFIRVELLLQSIHFAPFCTVAIAQGRAIGAGADLFASCEKRWIVGAATFSFPGAAFGLVLGTSRLARIVGRDRAREYVRTGRSISEQEALNACLATQAVDRSTLESELEQLALSASRLSPITQQSIYLASAAFQTIGAEDLYALAQSAARAGLKVRIEAYRTANAGIASPVPIGRLDEMSKR